MKTYQCLKIFIASPGDLNEERNIFINIITEINITKAHSMGFHLEPVGWEDTLPGFGRPQALINTEIDEVDLFIMLLWERWGTPSGEYSSGTEEEFYYALALKTSTTKPDMWLFFKNIVSDINVDIQKICDFKREIESARTHFYKTFIDSNEWRNLLRVLLCKWLDTIKPDERTYTFIPETIDDEIATNSKIMIEVSYLDWDFEVHNFQPEIYFTILDSKSLEAWSTLGEDDKKVFIYDHLSEHLYLTLGVSVYSAIMRFKEKDGRLLLLGTIAYKYGASIEECRFYIPLTLNQHLEQSSKELKLIDFWRL